MKEICVLIAENKRKGLKRYLYNRKTVQDFGIALNIYTVFCPKSVFTARRITKICSKFDYVYSDNIIFSKYCKKKDEPLINYIPQLSLTKFANIFKVNLAKENIGIVIKNKKFVNSHYLSTLCKNIKYLTVYNSDKSIDVLIRDTTGICVQQGKDYSEKLLIYLDENIYFKSDGKTAVDVKLSVPENIRTLFPAEGILFDILKEKNAEKILKKYGVNICGFTYT